MENPADETFTLNTPFSAMPIGRLNRWIAWANSHDWGGDHPARFIADSGEIATSGACKDEGGDWYSETAYHKTPRAMRDWAGY